MHGFAISWNMRGRSRGSDPFDRYMSNTLHQCCLEMKVWRSVAHIVFKLRSALALTTFLLLSKTFVEQNRNYRGDMMKKDPSRCMEKEGIGNGLDAFWYLFLFGLFLSGSSFVWKIVLFSVLWRNKKRSRGAGGQCSDKVSTERFSPDTTRQRNGLSKRINLSCFENVSSSLVKASTMAFTTWTCVPLQRTMQRHIFPRL